MTLPTLAQITNYAEEAAERPIDQYRDKPRLLGWMLSYVNRCQELESAAWDVIIKRMIDYATDSQLDTIGKIVGQRRNGQSDHTYRVYITARIRINRSQGHADDVIDVLMLVEAALFAYTEYYPASALIEYGATPSTAPNVLIDLAKLAVSAGVQLQLTAIPEGLDSDNTFECRIDIHGDADEAIAGFGHAGSEVYGGACVAAFE